MRLTPLRNASLNLSHSTDTINLFQLVCESFVELGLPGSGEEESGRGEEGSIDGPEGGAGHEDGDEPGIDVIRLFSICH